MQRVATYAVRLIKLCRQQTIVDKELSAEELTGGEQLLCYLAQLGKFPDEIREI